MIRKLVDHGGEERKKSEWRRRLRTKGEERRIMLLARDITASGPVELGLCVLEQLERLSV